MGPGDVMADEEHTSKMGPSIVGEELDRVAAIDLRGAKELRKRTYGYVNVEALLSQVDSR